MGNEWFLWSTIEVLSSYSKHECPETAYPGTFLFYVMVFCSFLPFITYFIMTFLSFYERNASHFAKAQGAFLCDFLTWALQSALPSTPVYDDLCEGRRVFRVSAGSAVAVYFSLSFFASELMKPPRKDWKRRLLFGNLTLWYVANVVMSCYSQVFLHMSTGSEVATGAAVGCFSAVIGIAFDAWVLRPRDKKQSVGQYISSICLLDAENGGL